MPDGLCDRLREVANVVTRGWGMTPLGARTGGTRWKTALFPKDGGYVFPITDKVRLREGLVLGDMVTLELAIRA